MKKFFILFITLLCIFCIASASLASNGQAIFPKWWNIYTSDSQQRYSFIDIYNITSNPVDVKITLYNRDGTLFTDSGNSDSAGYIVVSPTEVITNYSEINSGSTITFTLGANQGTGIKIARAPSPGFTGYGIIEWTQNSTVEHALIASHHLANVVNGVTQYITSPINSGNPF